MKRHKVFTVYISVLFLGVILACGQGNESAPFYAPYNYTIIVSEGEGSADDRFWHYIPVNVRVTDAFAEVPVNDIKLEIWLGRGSITNRTYDGNKPYLVLSDEPKTDSSGVYYLELRNPPGWSGEYRVYASSGFASSSLTDDKNGTMKFTANFTNGTCGNGFDDDDNGTCDYGGCDINGDTIIDIARDPACRSTSSNAEVAPECNDLIDNDGDTLIDGGDPGCSSLGDTSELDLTVECDDGVDNDGDTAIDSADPGCSSVTDPSELGTNECDDGIDNDGDTLFDTADPDCTSIADTTE